MKLAGAKILVTGGAGFIGAAIVRRLLAEGARVRVLDDYSRGSPQRLADVQAQLELVSGDVRDPEAVARACEGIDVVFHLAFVNGTELFYSKPDLVLEVGVKGMVNVLDACKLQRVRKLVLASSSEVYQTPPVIPTPENVPLVVPDPNNPRYSYGGGKIISELMAIHCGRDLFDELFIFRPHNVFGPNMGFEHVVPQFARRLRDLSRAQPTGPLAFPIQGSGEETRALIYIEDFVDGLITMFGGAPGIYHIGSEQETSVRELAELVGQRMGREVRVQPGPLQPGSTMRRCPDTTKLRALGFHPKTSLTDALDETLRWYNQFFESEAPKKAGA